MGSVRRIVYVASLTHGGSTLLDMLLSCHASICGVGEVARVLDPVVRARLFHDGKRRFCSCGRAMTPRPECPLWAPLVEQLDRDPPATTADAYAALLERVGAIAPATEVLCDSSKSLAGLRALWSAVRQPALSGVDLRVIHLLRDVRSFTVSRRARRKESGWAAWRRFGEWYRANRRIERWIAEAGVPSFRLGYEELCLHPGAVLPDLCDFLGVGFEPSMLDLGRSAGHVGIGNPMRMDAVRSSAIQYDHRWFRDDAVTWVSLLRPRIRRYNRERVYARVPAPPRERRRAATAPRR